jgi:hypothetical protein
MATGRGDRPFSEGAIMNDVQLLPTDKLAWHEEQIYTCNDLHFAVHETL